METTSVVEGRAELRKHGLSGPWDYEPDRIEWKSPTGLDCLMVRHPSLLHWCGYVGVPVTNKHFGSFYDDVAVDIHGGLTYSDRCRGHICHETGGGDHVWWLGFDCAHAGDLSPGMLRFKFELNTAGTGLFERNGDIYRDSVFVKRECENLAAQLARKGLNGWIKMITIWVKLRLRLY